MGFLVDRLLPHPHFYHFEYVHLSSPSIVSGENSAINHNVVCLYITSYFCLAAFKIFSFSHYFFKYIFLPPSLSLLLLLPSPSPTAHVLILLLLSHRSLRLCSFFFNFFLSFSSSDWMISMGKCSSSLIPVHLIYCIFQL